MRVTMLTLFKIATSHAHAPEPVSLPFFVVANYNSKHHLSVIYLYILFLITTSLLEFKLYRTRSFIFYCTDVSQGPSKMHYLYTHDYALKID